MYLLAQEVERSDKELLLNGIKLAKFDYVEFNRIEKRHIERLTSLDKQLKELLNNKHNNTNPKEAKKISTKIAEIEKTIREVEGEMSYIDMCNIYQRRVEGLISSRAK